jgi:hypothetical protein
VAAVVEDEAVVAVVGAVAQAPGVVVEHRAVRAVVVRAARAKVASAAAEAARAKAETVKADAATAVVSSSRT